MFIGNFLWIRLKKTKEKKIWMNRKYIQPSKVKNQQQDVEFLQKYVYNAHMSKHTIFMKKNKYSKSKSINPLNM